MSEFQMGLHHELQQIASHALDYEGSGLREVLRADALREKAAVCVLFSGRTFAESKILLTERSSTLSTHAGQVAFAGGSFDREDAGDPVVAAFRECEEEVGISRSLPQALGVLPSFPTMTGHFEVFPVIAFLEAQYRNVPMVFGEAEVTAAEWVSVELLRQTRQHETRTVSGISIRAPYFMWGERKMWGLSAWIFDLILNRYDTI